ncbi:hypothetical protein [Mucilaginibacter pedocola]|uniref:Uncharacterized protein n=1 Tax=Mucilaginibacter pedocola TaxID=1792845 RepID=A0A1S9PIW5_9SPHI|nr:hypothetical protein [Mucilaginibacter pedocola]OOQ60518.1 hypothetical protein BC343_24820 [Mucilaginibacter pedocola]
MKPIIKYISLLIFSGLILPFYTHCSQNPATTTPSDVVKTASLPAENNIDILPYIYHEIAAILLPALTNLK